MKQKTSHKGTPRYKSNMKGERTLFHYKNMPKKKVELVEHSALSVIEQAILNAKKQANK